MIPFGARVCFRPSLTDVRETPKLGPKAVPGIFLGYVLRSGCLWRGSYQFVSLDDLVAFRTGASKGIYVHESLELVKDDRAAKTFEFPAFRGDP
eukprot:8703359-Alexandrium_andersonii.AAC.1